RIAAGGFAPGAGGHVLTGFAFSRARERRAFEVSFQKMHADGHASRLRDSLENAADFVCPEEGGGDHGLSSNTGVGRFCAAVNSRTGRRFTTPSAICRVRSCVLFSSLI